MSAVLNHVIDLTPLATGKPVLEPETPVLVINRGHATLTRKWDGLDYALHPHTKGLIRMAYGAAIHFQKHTTVPGTRDVETGSEQSYLGILRTDQAGWPGQIAIDLPEACEPFTEEECLAFGQRIEAIQREPGEEVVTASVTGAMTSGRIQAGRNQSSRGGRKGVAFSREGVTASGARVGRDQVFVADEDASGRNASINEEAAEA